MHETAVLHFDLSHLSPGQPFTLHAGSRRYELTPHTRDSLARARRANAALGLVPDHRVTHFSGPVRLPGNCPLLLRVTGPKLRDDELLDRLVLTSVHLPRRHRAAALARRRQRQGGPLPPSPKLAALGVTGDDRPLPPDKELIDLGGLVTPWDAAKSLVFHHAELVTMQAGRPRTSSPGSSTRPGSTTCTIPSLASHRLTRTTRASRTGSVPSQAPTGRPASRPTRSTSGQTRRWSTSPCR